MSYLCYHQSEGLNRTFYGIETSAPLQLTSMAYFRLNRTFYGIETRSSTSHPHRFGVLIVPFMELKRYSASCVNRISPVLIVPFMELKRRCRRQATAAKKVLIVPFMELKLYLFSSFLLHQICLNRTFYGIETYQELYCYQR